MKIAVILPSLLDTAPIKVAKDIVETLISQGCKVDVFYLREPVELIFNCSVRRIGIFEKIEFEKYDFIHSHMLRPDFYIWIHRKSIQCVCVSTLHNEIGKVLEDYYGFIRSKIFTPLWVMFLRSHDKVVCLSKVAQNQLERKYRIKRVTYIYNGRTVPQSFISKIDKKILKAKAEQFILLGVIANISRIKGISQIIEVLDDLEEYCLVIIGSGPELEHLKLLAREKGLEDRCVFFGYKKNAFVFLEYIDVYMMTSYSEGFPLVLIEAAQYSKPTVCSNLPIFKEFFNKNQVSFFDLDNKASLIEAIKDAVDRKNILAENIYSAYVKKYTKDIMGENYYKLFKKLME